MSLNPEHFENVDILKCVKIAKIVKFCLDFPYFFLKFKDFGKAHIDLKRKYKN